MANHRNVHCICGFVPLKWRTGRTMAENLEQLPDLKEGLQVVLLQTRLRNCLLSNTCFRPDAGKTMAENLEELPDLKGGAAGHHAHQPAYQGHRPPAGASANCYPTM